MTHPSPSPAPRGGIRRALLPALVLVFLAGAATDALAQQRFQLRRAKRETTPVTAKLYAGYNGMSDPSEKLQELVENSGNTSWSGVMLGLQVLLPIDTIGLPLWYGADVFYHRVAKRFMANKGVVYRSDRSPVISDETIDGYGGYLLLGVDITRRIGLIGGIGVQYLWGRHDVASEIEGGFEPVTLGSAFGALNFAALVYDHGSIDFQFRAARGFGEYGSLQIQSLLCFTFNF